VFDNLDYLAPSRTISHKLGFSTPPCKESVEIRIVYCGGGTAFLNEYSKLKQPDSDASNEDRAAYRERVARLFAQHGIVGWKNVTDGKADVPFSTEACTQLLRKLARLKDSRGEIVGRWAFVDEAMIRAMRASEFGGEVESDDLGKE
jgi:hypothetical protein